jgi:hypothetical protein
VLSLTGEPSRPGGIRLVAEAVASRDPEIFCVHAIDEGDALALATRFDCGYAYRGRQALFWKARFAAREVLDRYLPGTPLRPFDRRGLLQVDGIVAGGRLALIATQFATERAIRVREARFTRAILRTIDGAALLFATGVASGAISFRDLQFETIASESSTLVAARGAQAGAIIVKV